ncbi:hypothetical protein GCM10027162_66030 [Streptomyces incanus]
MLWALLAGYLLLKRLDRSAVLLEPADIHAVSSPLERSQNSPPGVATPPRRHHQADALGISQRTVERYVKDQIRRPRADLVRRLEDAVRERWQPRVRERARPPGRDSNKCSGGNTHQEYLTIKNYSKTAKGHCHP